MATKIFPNPNPNPTNYSNTSSASSDSVASRASKAPPPPVDAKTLDKAMSGVVLSELIPQITAYFKATAESLHNIGATPNARWDEHLIKANPASAEDPKRYLETHFLTRCTSKQPVHLLMGKLLGDLEGPELKKWFTPQQIAALKTFFNPEQVVTAKSSTGASQGGAGDSQGEGTEDEFEAFHKALNEADGGGGQTTTSTQAYYSSPGGAPTGGGVPQSGGAPQGGGSLRSFRESYSGTGGGGGPTGPGGSPTGPGGFAPPPPPPPPPPTGSGMGGGTPYDEYMNKLPGMMQTENDYLNSNFSQGDPFYGWFQNLFGSENWYRDFSAKSLTELQAIKGQKEKILGELAHININSADGQKQIQILNAKLSDVQQNERQCYDNISSAQKANNERKEMIKAIFEMYFQTSGGIVRNIGK